MDTRLTYLFAMSHDRNAVVKNEKVTAEDCAEMITIRKCKYGQLQWRNGILQTNNQVAAKKHFWNL